MKWLFAGGLALAVGSLLGWNSALLEAIATPPALIRAALVGGSVVLGLWLLSQALRRISTAAAGRGDDDAGPTSRASCAASASSSSRSPRSRPPAAGWSATRCRSSSRS